MNYLFLALIFSTSVCAGFKEDRKDDILFCSNITKDSNKIEMVNEKWQLTKSYIIELKKDPVLLRRQMFCDVGVAFERYFETRHQPRFEILAKKRLNIDEVNTIEFELLEHVYNDTPKAHKDAFLEKWPGIEKYFTEKMRLVLAARMKPAIKK